MGESTTGKAYIASLARLKAPRVLKSLQDLLYDRQTGHDVVEIDNLVQREAGALPEDRDPDRGINENHGVGSDTLPGLRERPRDRLPRGPTRRGRECAAL
jgi:hypothetical protein